MKTLLALALFAGIVAAQDPTLTVTNGGFTVKAPDGDSSCVFTAPRFTDTGTITCFRGKTEELFTHWHASIGTGVSGAFSIPLHVIAWTLTHVGAGVFSWSISLDGGAPLTGIF